MNYIIKVANVNGVTKYRTMSKDVEEFCNFCNELGATAEAFKAKTMPLTALPQDIQDEVKDTLVTFDRISVIYKNSSFYVSTLSPSSKRSKDFCVCGTYYALDLFTTDERRQAFIDKYLFNC